MRAIPRQLKRQACVSTPIDGSVHTLRPGEPFPLGAAPDSNGTNFSLFSEVASRVELCLFDRAGHETHVDLPERTAFCWHGHLKGVAPGQRYGFRVHGPWEPSSGHRCNPAKLLLDPYALAVTGTVDWQPAVFPYPLGGDDGVRDEADSARFVPKSVVIDGRFDWGADRPLGRKLDETVIYEAHVKGLTMWHPEVPEALRGTYAGVAHPAIVAHLVQLGVTAIELMPVHQFIHEKHLLDRGLRNYWGYHSIGYFAPHNEYSHSGDEGEQVIEFKRMVKALHEAGLEVILDVVYNHTGEGNHLGPMLSLKGIDNRAYYRTVEGDARYYMDYTGTGNSLNMRHPHVLQLIMDSLRYWVSEMHVDGFRFDLASTLARGMFDVDRLSAFFDVIHQDPVLSHVKLIAEPWDLGTGGYQVGNFPVRWCEWNGKYRDIVRDYWRGAPASLPEFARRLSGSADLYENDGRRPYASVNFVTAHDGFTLRDLVSYNEKHNESNVDQSQDGESENRSWNCGAEGPTDDPEIQHLRSRQQRNLVATLMLSQGIPMMLGGDELGRTQQGNNNAYCQDNELSWFDWASVDQGLLAFARRIIGFRNQHPIFRRRRWFQGRVTAEGAPGDIAWFRADGLEMTEENWQDAATKSLGVFLNGEALLQVTDAGRPVRDDSFLLLFNAHSQPRTFTLPPAAFGSRWQIVMDTSETNSHTTAPLNAGDNVEIADRSLVVLSRLESAAERQRPTRKSSLDHE